MRQIKKIIVNIFIFIGTISLFSFVLYIICGIFYSAIIFSNEKLNFITKLVLLILISLIIIFILILKIRQRYISKPDFKRLPNKILNHVRIVNLSLIFCCISFLSFEVVYFILTPIIKDLFYSSVVIEADDISNENINISYVFGSLHNFLLSLFEYIKKYFLLFFLIILSYILIPIYIIKLFRFMFPIEHKYLIKLDRYLEQI